MNRLFFAMDVHKENIVVVGLPKEGPILWFGRRSVEGTSPAW